MAAEWNDQEGEIARQTNAEQGESIALWVEGLDLLVRSIDILSAVTKMEPVLQVQMVLFAQAINCLRCAQDLVVRGYYTQGLNLLRLAQEDWMAFWFLRNFPEEHRRFTKLSEETPQFEAMLARLESKKDASGGKAIREARKQLHSFSHVDRLAVRFLIDESTSPMLIRLGPYYEPLHFLRASSEIIVSLLQLIDAMNALRLLAIEPFRRKAAGWLRRAAGQDPGEDPAVGE